MSRPAIPAPKLTPPSSAEAPPDLSGGGEIMQAPAEARSTRPGPQPRAQSETFLNGGSAAAPDVKVLNERKYDAARSKVRAEAVKAMPDLSIGTKLPGPAPLPTEGETTEEATTTTEETPPAEEPKLDAKTAEQIAAKDRENRELRRKMKAIETSGLSAAKKEAKLKELAKTNPRGVAEYLGIDFMTYLQQVQKGESTPIVLEEDKPARAEDDETTKLRAENERLRSIEAQRTAQEFVKRTVMESKGEDGKLRWGRVARVGDKAIQAVTAIAAAEAAKMRRLTPAEARTVVEHFLDEKEAEYKAAGAAEAAPTRNPPNPRKPTTVAPKNPMDIRTARDESDPRNRPSSREIAARVRARLIG